MVEIIEKKEGNHKRLIITIIIGATCIGLVITALVAKGIMDANMQWVQLMGLITEEVIPPTAEITEGNATFQNALFVNQITMLGGIGVGILFGVSLQSHLSLQKKRSVESK